MKQLIFLAMGMFTIGCNSFIIAGLLPQISETFEQPISIIGQSITIFSLAYFLSAPIFSMIFTQKSAKNIIQLALTIFVFGNLLTIISNNIILFFIGRALVGIGAGIFTPLCITIAIHFVGASSKGRVLSFVWGANSAGVVFGVPIGIYLSSLVNWKLSIFYIVFLGLITLIGFSIQQFHINLPTPSTFIDRINLIMDKKIMSIIGVTCFTTVASLGLYSYIASIQVTSPHSLSLIMFIWGLGGFIGSSLVGIFIDGTKRPQMIMAMILLGLFLTIILIPFTVNILYFGLIPIFIWGAFGWATTAPQQHILFDLREKEGVFLAALNASAIGLGAAIGTALGGLIIAFEFRKSNLCYFAAILLLIVFIWQLKITNHSLKESHS